MPSLSDRIENVLNESRMLLLGGQVLIGFSYRICFERRFDQISFSAQVCQIVGLAVMTAGLGLLIWPAAFHQIAENGEGTEAIHIVTTRVLDWGLLPFAAGFGLTFYAVSTAFRAPHKELISSMVAVVALTTWYGGGLLRFARGRRGSTRKRLTLQEEQQHRTTDLGDRIKKVLIECRMALPGAQAFLGFQFAIVFTDGFEKLPRLSQWVHFVSLLATTVAIVLLIAPAAYHRLAEAGENTEHFHAVASGLMLAALVFLAPGIAGDLFVVIRKVTGSLPLSSFLAGALLLAFYMLWFGVSLLNRKKLLRKRGTAN